MTKQRKIGTAIVAATILMFLLFGQITSQVYATTTPTTISTEMHFEEDIWVQSKSLQIQTNYTMKRTDTLQYGMQFTQLIASGWIEVNGERFSFRFNTEKYPTYKIYSVFNKENEKVSSTSIGALSSPVRYWWDGIAFISVDSLPLHVEYDHVDNGPYEPSTYDIPPNEANPTTTEGYHRHHSHIPIHIMQDIITTGTLISLASAIGALIALLLTIPEVISKIIALFLSIIAGILAILGLAVRVFAEMVLRTELGDGWTWIWGEGSLSFLDWTVFWWWQSFGKWRNWGWFFTTIRIGGPGCRREMGRTVMAEYAW